MRFYGEFTKRERRADGTVVVAGICSSEAVDSDGEVITAAAMKAALPAYWKGGPAVREQHDPLRAVGTGLSAEVDADGRTHFECLVVDPVAVAKITSEPPVLRGFSIGGNIPPGGRDPANAKIVRALSLTEISLVDRPANPEARISVWKADANPTPPSGDVEVEVPAGPGEGSKVLPAHTCGTCGGPLTCTTCDPGAVAEKVAKLAGSFAADSIAKAYAERDNAVAKALRLEGERDALAKRLSDAQAELARRPKGALKAVPISKAEDTGEAAPEPGPEPDAFSLVKAAHRRPLPAAGDGGPFRR